MRGVVGVGVHRRRRTVAVDETHSKRSARARTAASLAVSVSGRDIRGRTVGHRKCVVSGDRVLSNGCVVSAVSGLDGAIRTVNLLFFRLA
ncbi:hypothetical protein [Halorubrum salsamenti]|uniref:hypothetical protein n=1 Tax=Halorubrum salsamenti TaxID=2583990 RepID=UPI0011A44653|nr:hypothetical protein [Halorubrum salsamenti]